ncbi:MAG: ABC transporter ATP-binding protein [Burkholderiaceae bacterium]|nr:ABC transporter ATP-binding protein [Burkholderiaceae bacterium]
MALKADNLTAGYGDITVLRDVSLHVGAGEIIGILGRNGMGKTTLIRCLAGLIKPSVGSISFEGQDVTALKPYERARCGFTTIVQGRGVFPQMTVAENLEMGRIAAGRGGKDRLSEVFGYFPRLEERMGQQAGTMSGGEQQMLAIGRGLMANPKLMLLDEPSDGIMPSLVAQIAEILVEINQRQKMTIIIVEQNVPMVFKMAKRCLIIEKGGIVAEGSPDELSNSNIMKEYLAI